jgi:predicted DNA-binding transcriptional regulator YafY
MMRIHQALQAPTAGKLPNASTLARDLEVSTKTIQRDLEFMRDRLQLPLTYDEARFGYHYTEEVDSFPTLQITEGELFALLVAEKALQQYRGTPFEKRLVGAFQKLAKSLPDTISLNLAEWDQTISFHTSAEPVLNLSVIDTLASSASQRRQLRIQYRKPNSPQPEERIIDPYHLANINGDWYLFAYDHLRKDIRTFVPSRIAAAEPTGKGFERPVRFTLPRQLQDSFGVHSKQGDFTVVARFDPAVADYLREKRWHPSQQIRELPQGGGVELTLRLGSLVEVQRWLLGWGASVQVLAPPELVTGIRAAAKTLVQRHGG